MQPYDGNDGQRNGSVYIPEVFHRKRSAKTLFIKNGYEKVEDSETILDYSFDMGNGTLSITVNSSDDLYSDFVDMVAKKWEEKYGKDKATIISDY